MTRSLSCVRLCRSSIAWVPAVVECCLHARFERALHVVQQVCGDKTLIHWEDFGSGNAAVLLKRYRARGPTFNDDIQSTAAVALAALIGACRADAALPLTEQRFMFLGAGQAGLGIGELVIQALEAEVRTARTHCAQAPLARTVSYLTAP